MKVWDAVIALTTTKSDKEEVHYRVPQGEAKCGNCKFYSKYGRVEWGSCRLVKGSIDAKMVCDWHMPQGEQ